MIRKRRLNEEEYRTLGRILSKAAEDERYTRTIDIIRQIAMSGCRRSEIIEVQKAEIDTVGSAFRFGDTKEGQSVRLMGLPIIEYFDERDMDGDSPCVFAGERNRDGPFGSFPRHWEKIFTGTELADLTAHVLRHSFASMVNDLGFTEITIAALLGHALGSITSRFHTLDALVMAADTVSGYIQAPGRLDPFPGCASPIQTPLLFENYHMVHFDVGEAISAFVNSERRTLAS